MGRLKPAYYYQKKATEAQARADYYRTRPAPTTGTTVNTRGPATPLYYRSMLLRAGINPLIYAVSVDNDTLQGVTAAQAGLLTELADGDVALRMRGSGVKPTRLHWMRGDTTPTRVRTDWNTSWTRYYTAGGGSHKSMPFSRATGAVTPTELQDAFDGLFGASGTKRSLLGTANGRAYLEFERAPISANG